MDELLNALLGIIEPEDSTLIIDNNLRTIAIPNKVANIGVTSDDDVLRLKFKMPRYCSEFDLSEFDMRINYLNAVGEGDVYYISDAVVEEDYILFTWLVGRHASKYKGNVKFNICLKKTNSEHVIIKEFNTTIATLPVLEGLETSERVIQENADILEVWREEWEQRLFEPNYAYEAAKNNGFVGTEAEWVASLKGDKGDTGIYVGAIEPTEAPYFWFDTSKHNTIATVFVDVENQKYSLDDANFGSIETVQENQYDLTIK